MKFTALATALGLGLAATLCMAADPAPATPQATDAPKAHKGAAARFKEIDTNGDGKISRDEANAKAPRLAKRFDEIDTNKDGFITPDEMKAARARHQAQSAPKQ